MGRESSRTDGFTLVNGDWGPLNLSVLKGEHQANFYGTDGDQDHVEITRGKVRAKQPSKKKLLGVIRSLGSNYKRRQGRFPPNHRRSLQSMMKRVRVTTIKRDY